MYWDEGNEELGGISEKGKIFKVAEVKEGAGAVVDREWGNCRQKAPEYEIWYCLSSPICGAM